MVIDRPLLAASWRSWISSDNRAPVGPAWLQWVWTTLFSAALAVPFTVLGFVAFASGKDAWRNLAGWAHWYGKNLVVSLCIGYTIHLLFLVGRRVLATPERLPRWRSWQRTLYFSGTPLLGVAIAWPLGVQLSGGDVLVWVSSRDGNNIVLGSVLIALGLTFLFHHFFASKTREIEADRRATEAQLRLLQAQIEPHFLFNTLANVQTLMDHDLPRAKLMLENFTDYLRSSLSTLRVDHSPLSQELDLARNYLLLLQARMEDRLKFSIDADAEALQIALPPLLLQPLVENAVVHGLEPSIEGGSVRITARVMSRRLLLEVHDDGHGLEAPARRSGRSGAGMALNNIRQRLQARYGGDARLDLIAGHPGTCARITLPIDGPIA